MEKKTTLKLNLSKRKRYRPVDDEFKTPTRLTDPTVIITTTVTYAAG